VEYSVDRFSDCEHRAYGALRATDRRSDPASDDRIVRIVRAGEVDATRASRSRARATADLRGYRSLRESERRSVVLTHMGRGRGAGCRICDLHALSAKVFPLGIVRAPGANYPDTALWEVCPRQRCDCCDISPSRPSESRGEPGAWDYDLLSLSAPSTPANSRKGTRWHGQPKQPGRASSMVRPLLRVASRAH